MKRPLNELGVKNISEAHLTYKSICGYTVEKNPSSALSVTNVSPGNRHCFITKENSILIHLTNVNHVVKISLMTMLWGDMIARNDLPETRKDSLAGCVMNTATIIVDIFITCINKQELVKKQVTLVGAMITTQLTILTPLYIVTLFLCWGGTCNYGTL